MAAPNWTSAALSAAEQADLALDLPLIGANAIPAAPTTKIWTEVGQTGSSDRTDSDYPASRAYDGLPHLPTSADATASSTWYFVFNFGEGIEFDFAAIMGHDFGTDSLTSVTIELDDGSPPDGTFGSTQTIADFGAPSDDTRLMDLVLKHTGSDPRRYTDVQYLRLKLTKGSNFTPQFGLLILGRRRQMTVRPVNPFDKDRLHNESALSRSQGGVVNKTIYHEARFDLDATFLLSATADIADVKAWFQQTRGQMVWMWEPSSAPNSWYLVSLDPDDLHMPSSDYTERSFSVAGTEQGPERFFLAKES
jgi:hypothetical protein